MNRNLKVLGLALVAALAMTALVASAAQANNEGKFTATSYPGTLHGEDTGTHVFTAAGGTVNCTNATFTGSFTEASKTQTITPEYSGCTAFGFIGATVTMNGCDYLFHLTGTGAGGAYNSTVDLVCPAGKEITIDAGPCMISLPGQTGLPGSTFTNSGGTPSDVTNHANVTGITGVLKKENALCFFTAGHFTNGTYKGSTTVTGKNAGGAAQSIDIG